MDSGKSVGLLLVLVGILGIYLESQGKLGPSWSILTGPDTSTSPVHLGTLAIALVGFVAVLSLLSDDDAALLTLLFVLGALLYNHKTSAAIGQSDVLSTLLP